MSLRMEANMSTSANTLLGFMFLGNMFKFAPSIGYSVDSRLVNMIDTTSPARLWSAL